MPLLGRQVVHITPGREAITYRKEEETQIGAKSASKDKENDKENNNTLNGNGVNHEELAPEGAAAAAAGNEMETDMDVETTTTTQMKKTPSKATTTKRDVKDVKEIYVMRATGEGFECYDDYLARLKSYRMRKWACTYTGQTQLTFEEALLSEAKHGPSTRPMPETHLKPCLTIVHHNVLTTELLVKKILSTFSNELVPGELVTVHEEEHTVVGKVSEEEANGSPKYKLVANNDTSKEVTVIREVIKRPFGKPLNKQLVRKWLFGVATAKVVYQGFRKKQAWFVHQDLAKEHGLGQDLPEELSWVPSETKKQRVAKQTVENAKKRKADKEERDRRLEAEKAEKRLKLEQMKEARLVAKREKEEERKRQQTTSNNGEVVIKVGTMTHAAYEVLRNAIGQALTVKEVMERAQAAGLKDFNSMEKGYNKLFGCLSKSKLFVKVGPGLWACKEFTDEETPRIVQGPRTPDERLGKPPVGGSGAASPPGGASDKEPSREDHLIKIAKAAVSKYEAKVAKAEEGLQEATATAAEEAKVKPQKIVLPAELIWNPELEQFTGNSLDRKAVVGHKKWVETEKNRIAQEAQEYIKDRKRTEKASKLAAKNVVLKANADLEVAKQELKRAHKALIRAESLSLIKTGKYTPNQLTKDKELQRELEREFAAEERRRKKIEEKEQAKEKARLQREKEKEERLRQKEIEKFENKFPLEDTLLAEEITKLRESNLDVELPLDLPGLSDTVDSTFVQLCSITACLSTFGKMLGMQTLKFHELLEAVKIPGPALAGLYRDLLSVLLLDGSQHPSGLRRIRRWIYTMTSEWGCVAWPDVLARYVLTKPNVDPSVRKAAQEFQEQEYQSVCYESHTHLLQFLLDDVIETRVVHEMIDKWQEERIELLQQKRENRIEYNRKKRERREAEKEKRRKVEEEKRERKEMLEKMKTNGEDVTQMEIDTKEEEEEEVDEETRFEIPEEKLVFSGNPMDRKGVLAHKKWVETERARLQREREVYKKEQLKKQRELQAKLNEERKVLEAEALAYGNQQEAIDKELLKKPIRLAPLGMDRNKCKFFWNVAGQKSAIYVESPHNGEWKCFSDEATLDGYLGSLDYRGKRESALLDALEYRINAIRSSLRKPDQQNSNGKDRGESSPPTRSSSRRVASVPNYSENGGTGLKKSPSRMSIGSQDSEVLGSRSESLEFLGHEMESIALMAEKCGVGFLASSRGRGDGEKEEEEEDFGGSWKEWFKDMKTNLREEPSLEALEMLLLDLENSIHNSFPNGEEMDQQQKLEYTCESEFMENSSSDEEIDERSLEGYARLRRKARSKLIWYNNQERESWVSLVRKSKTVSQVSYCAAVLSQRLVIVQRSQKKTKSAKVKKVSVVSTN